jgi:uroporphyrinogen III methyltransferase/synthase
VSEGKVWLVGAGPGDPGLLTLKGSRAIASADAIVYDRLANESLLGLASATCERIYAGKLAGDHSATQAEINDLLIRLAREHKQVVRLKGGDPFVFGRGGEEAEALRAAGVEYEIVPGVTSAIAVPAYAGIPVTHRGVASSVAIVTGHEDPSKADSSVDWQALASGVDTLVCLMGLHTLAGVTERLRSAGLAPSTPAAVISFGTLPSQRAVFADLGSIVERVRSSGIESPAIAVFGNVVRLGERLRWFENRPLFGKRVLITRTREQSSALRSALEELGAEVLELPTIELVDGVSPQILGSVVEALADGEYSWVVFTSANGVRRFMTAVYEQGRDARAFHDAKLAVVGPATAEALREYGIRADATPDEFDGGSLGRALATHDLSRRRILVARAEAARPELVQILRLRGAEVEEIPLYSSEVPRNPDPAILAKIQSERIDVVTFASSSSVRNLSKMLGPSLEHLRSAVVACIGPLTAETAARCGLAPQVVPAEHTIPGLVRALREYLARPVADGAG